MTDEFDVFLSHTPADERTVEALAGRLRVEAKLRPCFRRWMLIPGEPWMPAIERAIERSTTVAVFYGPAGTDAWREEESQLALIDRTQRRVIPVLLPGASRQDVKGFLRARTWVDLADDDGFQRLIAGITGQAPELVTGFRPGSTLRRWLHASTESDRHEPAAEPAAPTPYRVFVSSTLCDEEQRRRDLLDTITMVGMKPCPAEPIPAGAGTPTLEARRRQLEGCDLLLMLVAWRYGRIPEGHERSILELEYEWAREHDLPRLVFLVDEERPIVVARDLDEAEQRWRKQERLQAFKARLAVAEPTVGFTLDNLGAKVSHHLHEWRREGAGITTRTRRADDSIDAARQPSAEATVEADSDHAAAAEPTAEAGSEHVAPAEPTVEADSGHAAPAEPTAAAATRPAKTKPRTKPRTKPKPEKRERRASKPRTRAARPRELSRYLEVVERDNATSTMFGSTTPLPVPLQPDDLRVKVRLVSGPAPKADADSSAPEPAAPEPELMLHEVFVQAERRGCRGVVLVGQPGSGKSTHLRRMALWLSRRNARTLGLPIDTVPIVLPLHELPPELGAFHDALVAHLQRDPALAAPFIDALLQRDHLLFLVDGFDELPTKARRDRVVGWLDEGLREHPHARFLVTQRPIEQPTGEAWPVPVLQVQLPPLDKPHARTLVERWFDATEGRDEAARAEARRRADVLWAELETPEFRATRMFELTRNPLMLTVLCTVHRERGRLPTRRVELYEQCVQVLVQRWCSTGTLPRRFGDREARQVLQPLAHWLHGQRGRTHADARSIAAAIEPELEAALGYEVVDAEAFLRAASTDDGILVARGVDGHGLLHLCLQEYLCARHLRSLSHGDPGVLDRLVERFGDPWWREVTLLLLALGEPALFEPFMQRVVQRPAFVEHLDWVVDCIHEAVGGSVEPLVGLLMEPPGDDPERWTRQLAAWRLLEKVRPERLPILAATLHLHPLEELRRLADPHGRPERVTRRSPRGGYLLVEIPAGRFSMGSHHRERGHEGGEGPRHEVELARFFMGKYPVTNEEYGLYLRAHPNAPEPAYWGDPRYNHPRQPVVGVSWHEAMAYCAWAGLSLPTEAQWERACRADTKTAYWSGHDEADLARVGWYDDNSDERLHPVGERDPNPFGLHDMHGNVWEWCLDGFGGYAGHPTRPGDGLRHPPQEGDNRMIRGGSAIDPARKARSAYRLNRHADNRVGFLGFRAALCVEPEDG